MFGMDVHTQPQIDPIVLDFLIFPHWEMARLKLSILGPQIGENWGFSPLKFLGGTYEHPYRR